MATIIPLDDLPHEKHSHELVGAEYGEVPFSVILVHAGPGIGPKLHRHPYPEVFIIESGRAAFQVGREQLEVAAGTVVVSPSGEAHGFVNVGTEELRLVAIHGAGRFDTEWLTGRDPIWSSKPRSTRMLREAQPADAAAVTPLVDAAYAPYIERIGTTP